MKFFKVILFGIILIGCKDNGEKIHKRENIRTNLVSQVFANLKPVRSTFEIPSNQESAIKSRQGTAIYFPANCFVFKDGSRPGGTIEISLYECYSNSTALGQEENCISAGELIKSRGRVKIVAKSESAILRLAEGAALQIGFRKRSSDEEMDLHCEARPGDEEIWWIPDYSQFEYDPHLNFGYADYADWKSMKGPVDITEDDYLHTFNFSTYSSIFENARVKGYGVLSEYIGDTTKVSAALAKKFYKNSWRVHLDLEINEKGKLCNFRKEEDEYSDANDTPEAIRLTKEIFRSIPPLDFKYLKGYKKGAKYTLGIWAYENMNWNKIKFKFRNKHMQSRVQACQKINHFERDYHVFPVTKLGWLNCAHFNRIRAHQRTTFKVFCAEKYPHKIRLIFKNNDGTRTILNGTTYKRKTRFYRLPDAQLVTIIGIGVRKGKPIFTKHSTKISERTHTLNNFKEIDMDALREELNKI